MNLFSFYWNSKREIFLEWLLLVIVACYIVLQWVFYIGDFPALLKPDTVGTATMFHTWLAPEIFIPHVHLVLPNRPRSHRTVLCGASSFLSHILHFATHTQEDGGVGLFCGRYRRHAAFSSDKYGFYITFQPYILHLFYQSYEIPISGPAWLRSSYESP